MKHASTLKLMTHTALRSSIMWMKHHPLFMGLLLIAILVRSAEFGTIPAGLNQDEAATAYDSWAVLNYGIDRNGQWLPMMFISWGSGMYALSGYLAWPFVWLFGLTITAIRLPHLFLGILACVLIYFCTFLLTKKRTVALTALFIVATNPWHIMVSRWGLDSNVFPIFFLIATTALLYSVKRPRLLLLSAFFYSLCLYTYGTAYIVVPIMLLGSAIALRLWWNMPTRILMEAALVTAVASLPVVLYVAINQWQWNAIELPFMTIPRLTGVPRYQTVSSIFSGNALSEMSRNFGTFWYLLEYQNDGLIWNVIPNIGLLYIIGLPFAIVGFFAAIASVLKQKGKDLWLFILIWFVAAVLLSMLQSVNVNRINIVFFPLLLFMCFGIHMLSQTRLIFNGILAVFTVYFALFCHAYFGSYNTMVGPAFHQGLVESLEAATLHTDGSICVTGHANMPYIFALFADKTDPSIFEQTVSYQNPGAEFQQVESFGRFTFDLSRCRGQQYDAYVVHESELNQFSGTMNMQRSHSYAAILL